MFGPSKLGNKSSLGSSVPRSLDGELQVRLQAPPYARDPIEGGPLPDSRPSIRRSGKGIRHEAIFTKLETKNGNGGIPTNYRK
ncbi:hypothetical protein MGG_17924 [Pyricularia oryzae 70-15]|uniref:Uncharacterized protein n=3 Tax=Pyricularia oryzae TaxID=318829 RepID=G4NLJ7_PYRO7|nr:uncharacterized protein MGG_17924 [Pyricularia oryzae 70-15]EHA46050.1 hypothetical protein MGG_17924 [Pyricularia oryzae 70-15]ELQ40182.1 hypothetical protein OOU_Y34scaffold00458g10 [Pyricularia oryzae Y34]